MRYTQNINLPIVEDNDLYSKDINNLAFEKIDEEIQGLADIVETLDSPENSIADVKKDINDIKSDVVDINEQLDNIANKQNWVNVLDFGAKCDGVTDDSEALINAINSANNGTTNVSGNYKRVVYIPSNLTITRDEKIKIQTGEITLVGNARTNSQIIFTSKNGGIEFIKNNGEEPIYEVLIENITFDGKDVCDTLLSINHVVNFYLKNVHFRNWKNGYAIYMNKSALPFWENITIDGGNPTVDNKYIKNGVYLNDTQFLSVKGCNIWNLNKLFTLKSPCSNFRLFDCWIEYVKNVYYIDPIVSNTFNYNKIKIYDSTISNGVDMTEFSLVNYNTTEDCLLFSNDIKISDVVLYMKSTNTLLNDTLININNCTNQSRVRVDVNGVIINNFEISSSSGKYFLKLNTTQQQFAWCFKIKSYDVISNGEICSLESASNGAYIYCESDKTKEVPSYYRGIKLTNSTTNEGKIYYSGGDIYFYYNKENAPRAIPKKSLTTFNTSVATDVSTLVNDFNKLVQELKRCNILS